ncbi:MAG: murein biosynthesis integral membrane protein MurJ, partial [Verrucomicrobia bacterium]|nr:murein biosynthesis integral membrane protein MurJ [Verrucomicrobiota bacterium]
LAKSAFDVAFTVPNLFRRLFGEGALSAAFVPVFAETLEQDGLDKANQLAAKVGTLLSCVLLVLVGGGMLGVSLVLEWATLGPKAAAVLPLVRIMFPYVLMICLVALAMGILNAFSHFATSALSPVLLNVIWIAFLLWVCPRYGETAIEQIHVLAWGILLGGLAQLLVQLPALHRHGIKPYLSFAWRDGRIRRLLYLMGPAALGMGVHQVNVLMDKLLALLVGDWAPAAMTYAERLIYLPLGLIATALGTVLLPTFSRHAARAEPLAMRATLGRSLCGLMMVMIPAAVGLIALGTPIVELIFRWKTGIFQSESTLQTVRALRWYAPGLIVFSIYKVVVPAFYGLQDTRTPVRLGVWCVLLNFGLNLLFIWSWPEGWKHAGLAFATVISSGVNGLVLALILHRRIGDPGWCQLGLSGVKFLIGSLLMAFAVHGIYRWGHTQVLHDSKGLDAGLVMVAIAGGLGVYALWLRIVASREWNALRGKRAKAQ